MATAGKTKIDCSLKENAIPNDMYPSRYLCFIIDRIDRRIKDVYILSHCPQEELFIKTVGVRSNTTKDNFEIF